MQMTCFFYASAAATFVGVLQVELLHILQLGQKKMNGLGEWMTVQL